MLRRVMLDGIELPRLYIAENRSDAELAKSKGIPFIRWTRGQDELIKILLRPVLEKMFPHIKWNKVLGPRRKFRTVVEIDKTTQADQSETVGRLDEKSPASHLPEERKDDNPNDETSSKTSYAKEGDDVIEETASVSSGERVFGNQGHEDTCSQKLSIEEYVGDMSSYVNIEVLQRLRLMPAFIGDILDCIKLNIGSGMRWREGYNKRLGIPVGRFDSSGQLPNLIILDVSGSIPRGISATMISLVDTLRTQLSADLIITSSISRFYPMGVDLPEPDRIRRMFGFSNESIDFFRILTNNIRGKHYGHVFSFGDNDTPDYYFFKKDSNVYSLAGTKVEHVHHYHTGHFLLFNSCYNDNPGDAKTGYAKWCHMLADKPIVDFDTSWCHVIDDR